MNGTRLSIPHHKKTLHTSITFNYRKKSAVIVSVPQDDMCYLATIQVMEKSDVFTSSSKAELMF